MRKIIQIATSEAGASNGYSRYLIALADDGTLWEKDVTNHSDPKVWERIEPLPQPASGDDIAF